MSSLSEWDVLALDEAGRPSNGVSDLSPAGVQIDVYENYLKIVGCELWHPMTPFQKPQAGVIRNGECNILDVFVIAKPMTRGGLVWATWFFRGIEVVGTVGVIAYGFSEKQEYVGVQVSDAVQMNLTLSDWVQEGRLPACLGKLGVENALRYNQGDSFFARQMGHALSATPPGEAQLPTLYHANPELLKKQLTTDTAPEPEPVIVKTKTPRRKSVRK